MDYVINSQCISRRFMAYHVIAIGAFLCSYVFYDHETAEEGTAESESDVII